jgi:hypothetical protein
MLERVYIMSHAMTKLTKCVCDQHGTRPACASAQSDQDPCCSLSFSLLVIGLVIEQHGSWSDCADAQVGLDPCWSQTHYVGFVMARLNYIDASGLLAADRSNLFYSNTNCFMYAADWWHLPICCYMFKDIKEIVINIKRKIIFCIIDTVLLWIYLYSFMILSINIFCY